MRFSAIVSSNPGYSLLVSAVQWGWRSSQPTGGKRCGWWRGQSVIYSLRLTVQQVFVVDATPEGRFPAVESHALHCYVDKHGWETFVTLFSFKQNFPPKTCRQGALRLNPGSLGTHKSLWKWTKVAAWGVKNSFTGRDVPRINVIKSRVPPNPQLPDDELSVWKSSRAEAYHLSQRSWVGIPRLRWRSWSPPTHLCSSWSGGVDTSPALPRETVPRNEPTRTGRLWCSADI